MSSLKKLVTLLLVVIASVACLPADDVPATQADLVVAIDIGHSRRVFGARSARGVAEYEFNRNLALRLLKALHEYGYGESFLIDENGDLHGVEGLRRRPVIAQARNADLLISIHHDSVQEQFLKTWRHEGQERPYSDEFEGYSIIISAASPHAKKSATLARALGDEFLANGMVPTLYHALDIPGERRRLLDKNRGIYDIEFWIVDKAGMPAVLIEAGMIVNREEELKLSDERYRGTIVKGIVNSVAKYAQQR